MIKRLLCRFFGHLWIANPRIKQIDWVNSDRTHIMKEIQTALCTRCGIEDIDEDLV